MLWNLLAFFHKKNVKIGLLMPVCPVSGVVFNDFGS